MIVPIGTYFESSRCSKAKTDMVLYCDACGKVLMPIPAGDTLFTQTHGDCTCSWGCCEVSKASNKRHARHLAHKKA